jgi:hypothetical protein
MVVKEDMAGMISIHRLQLPKALHIQEYFNFEVM